MKSTTRPVLVPGGGMQHGEIATLRKFTAANVWAGFLFFSGIAIVWGALAVSVLSLILGK